VRVLIELGVQVYLFYLFVHFFQVIYHFCQSHSFKFVLLNKTLSLFENSKIPFTIDKKDIKNGDIGWDPKTETEIDHIVWEPSFNFVPQNIKNDFKNNSGVIPWIIVDEFF
jgi:hypothetical protein